MTSRARVDAPRFEWPTIAVTLAIYGGFLLWSWNFQSLPIWLSAPVGALLIAWHGSLQHETIHNHPTPWRRVNALIGAVPLSLWLPYALYRQSHLRHHRFGGGYLTDPDRDPESFYMPPGSLQSLGAVGRAMARANCTFLGRLLLGPLLNIGTFYASERAALASGDPARRGLWMRHTLAVTGLLAWVVGVCHIPAWQYLCLVLYPGTSLSLVRSFAEHRASSDKELRTAVVEANPFWSLLFLNNNLHIAHHARPRLPWYELPRTWRRMRGSHLGEAAERSGLVFHGGYAEVVRAYLLRPVISVEHPAIGAHGEFGAHGEPNRGAEFGDRTELASRTELTARALGAAASAAGLQPAASLDPASG